MTTIEFLNQAYALEAQIQLLLERRSAAISMATQSTSKSWAIRYGGTDRRSNLENAVCIWTEIEKQLNTAIDLQVDAKRRIIDVIRRVRDDNCRRLLYRRYIRFQTWREISEALDVSSNYARHGLRKKAVNFVHNMLYGIDK